MGSAVFKFLSLVNMCIVIIDGVLCHEEGKTLVSAVTYSEHKLYKSSVIQTPQGIHDNFWCINWKLIFFVFKYSFVSVIKTFHLSGHLKCFTYKKKSGEPIAFHLDLT